MMRKPIHSVWCSFSILFVVLNMVSCKKNAEAPDGTHENYTVGFKFQEFERIVSPLGTKVQMADGVRKRAASNDSDQGTYEGYLYYWSFNGGTLMPDSYPSTYWSITYNQGLLPDEYGIGWSHEDYVAGSALSLKGLSELIFKMPLAKVLAVDALAFDVSSSGTGPKAFSLYFSQDGQYYELLEETKQFVNVNTPQARNSFSYSLEALTLDFTRDLYIKLIPEAGFRGSAPEYNDKTGVMRIDNFRLSGVAKEVDDARVRRIHYHIFDAATKTLVLSGAEHFREGALSNFKLHLPAGDYLASFVANISDAELYIPEIDDARSYFMANPFSNYKAKIFGVLDTFSVQGDLQRELELIRYYSEIRFDFLDTEDLSSIRKLVIKREHPGHIYAPFEPTIPDRVEDVSEIVLRPEFEAGNQTIFFNQFIGDVSESVPLAYRIEAYDASDALLTTFGVEAEIHHNMQLLFRGKLLDGPNGGFVVRFNENWGGNKQIDF